ncbi:MAG: pyruvate formate lyase family protein, partial [Thermoguttaceae bacterium]
MTPHIESLKKYLLDRKHFQFRRTVDWDALLPQWDIDRDKQAANVLKTVLAEEAKHPVFLPNERIVLTRTCANLPERYPDEVMVRLRKEAYFHEKGVVFTLSPNFEDAISTGLDTKRAEAVARRERAIGEKDYGTVEFLDAVLSGIDAIYGLVDAYAEEARKQGLIEIWSMLSNIPRKPARNFHEALQFLRILHYTLWCEGAYHNGVGRFDQYMYPYLIADLEKGILTRETAFDLL